MAINPESGSLDSYLFRYSTQSQMQAWAGMWEVSETMIEMAEYARMLKRDAVSEELHRLAWIYRDGILNAIDAIIEIGKEDDAEAAVEAERAKNRPIIEDDE